MLLSSIDYHYNNGQREEGKLNQKSQRCTCIITYFGVTYCLKDPGIDIRSFFQAGSKPRVKNRNHVLQNNSSHKTIQTSKGLGFSMIKA